MTIDEVLDEYKEKVLTFADTPMVIPTAQRVAKAHLARIMAAERLDELERAERQSIYQGVSANPKYAVSTDYIKDRIAELTHQVQAGGEDITIKDEKS